MRRRGVPGGRVSPEALVTAANMRHAGQRCDNCGYQVLQLPVRQSDQPCANDEPCQLCALLRQGRRAREGGVAKDHATWFWAASHRRA